MKPKWLVENFSDDNGYESLIKEIKDQGYECHVLDITNHFELKRQYYKSGDCVLFQGSIQLFNKLCTELLPDKIGPFGWMSYENYLCNTYYPIFSDFIFNDRHVFMTVDGFKKNKWDIYNLYAKDSLLFVRPNSGNKLFPSGLLDINDFDKFWVKNDVSKSSLVLISTPKNIKGEWRFICSEDKEILGYSCYQYQGKSTLIPSAPKEAIDKCKEILNIGWYPDPFFTIDIVEDNDNKYWLMETNSFTSAGTYAADKKNIVKRVSEYAEKEWSL